jgi:hypothetical protein
MGHPEGCDAEDLNLPGLQPQLVEAILETGTPTVLLAVSGRPYALGQYQGRAAAIVQAFFPGEEGGSALAGFLTLRIVATVAMLMLREWHRDNPLRNSGGSRRGTAQFRRKHQWDSS